MGGEELTILVSTRHEQDLAEGIRALVPAARLLTREQLEKDAGLIEQVDIVFGGIAPEQFARARRLKWVQTTGAGVAWTQSPHVQAHRAVITNARIHAVQIAEHLFGMLLMLVHHLHGAVRNQQRHLWKYPADAPVRPLPGRTLCVLGLGVIGRRCAQLGVASGMRVIGVRRHPQPLEGVEEVFGPDRLDEALRRAEVLMNLLPGTAETRKIIGPRELDLLPDGALLLNAGRGSTVDTDALVEALRRAKLAGAGLDVVDPEPLPPEHPLWDLPNVILTSHYSGGVHDYHRQTQRVFLDNLRRFLAGEPLEGVVNKTLGY